MHKDNIYAPFIYFINILQPWTFYDLLQKYSKGEIFLSISVCKFDIKRYIISIAFNLQKKHLYAYIIHGDASPKFFFESITIFYNNTTLIKDYTYFYLNRPISLIY